MKVTERFVDIEGHRLACLAINEHLAQPGEPAVVFIHGVLASVNFWRAALPEQFTTGECQICVNHYPP